MGGGLSGLSLASALASHTQLPGSVIVSEPDITNLKSKTFSFWLKANEQDLFKPTTQCNSWSVSYDQRYVKQEDEELAYGTCSGTSILDEALNRIQEHPQIELRQEPVLKKPNAKYCFDSRPPDIRSFRIVQSFAGIEVELEQPHMLNTVQLMHDLITIENGIQFRYVIPLSPDRLLIEYTQFVRRPGDLEALMILNHAWAREMFGEYKVIRYEEAHIPMGIQQNVSHWGIPIGARAGMTRDATGYGFRTIIEWTHKESANLINGNRPQTYRQPKITHWMDMLFLRLIQHRPDTLPNILMTLAERLSAHQFAQFMIENRMRDVLNVIFHAPKRPFTCALLGKYSWI